MADSAVEATSSASMSSMAGPAMPSVQNIIPILSAIADNIQSVPRSPSNAASAAAAGITVASTDNDNEEPDIKRKKLDGPALASTSQISEKLESRLGGILCCAVCLDLPKMAMYQVGEN